MDWYFQKCYMIFKAIFPEVVYLYTVQGITIYIIEVLYLDISSSYLVTNIIASIIMTLI